MEIKINGVRVRITFLFTALIAFVLSVKAPANVLMTVLSSFLHEIGHLSVMIALGNYPEAVIFELTGINIKRMQSVKISMKNEIFTALGGPAANCIVFLICTFIFCFHKSEIILTVSAVNLILMIFNLLPVKGLDGGMILYFFLFSRFNGIVAEKTLRITSAVFLVLIYLWGFYILFAGGYNFTLLLIAVFLTFSAVSKAEY